MQHLQEEVDYEKNSSNFSIKRDFLAGLFEHHDISNKKSIEALNKLGGINGLVNALKTDLKDGINPINVMDFEERKKEFGVNKPQIKPVKTLFVFMKEAFEDQMLRILAIFGFISLAIGFAEGESETGWIDGFSIILSVFIIVMITSVNNYLKDKQFENLFRQAEKKLMNVKRNGKHFNIPSDDLLVGDILQVDIGDILSVDGILTLGSGILMDESSITGESHLIKKQPLSIDFSNSLNPFMISGSKVMDGEGFMLVCTVGPNTQIGILKMALQDDEEPTPLQVKLEGLAEDIGTIGLFAALLTIAVLLIHLLVYLIEEEMDLISFACLKYLLNSFLLGVTILVAAIPEGLPLAVTVALAYSIDKMKDENNFVKNLAACETMGGANNICTDKTGTLTLNKMQVTSVFANDKILEGENLKKEAFSPEMLQILCEGICINSSSNPVKSPEGFLEGNGSQTECALLTFSYHMGYNYQNVRSDEKMVKKIPFSSERKKMITVHKLSNLKYCVYAKGASEIVLGQCSSILMQNGSERLNATHKSEIINLIIKNFAQQTLRTIALAYKEIHFNANLEDNIDSDLTLIAIIGIMDPLREEIPKSINICQQAGITVRMVTGDNMETAIAIAKKAGILRNNYEFNDVTYEALDGEKFNQLCGGLIEVIYEKKNGEKKIKKKIKNPEVFKTIASELRVLARSSPKDKQTLVCGLKELKNIVAVTGDGTNDAIALKTADVGFAMNKAGTDVAKDAADIILLDDNFKSIVTACKWGRNIFDSVRKFVQFQLTINVVALVVAFLGSAVLSTSPLTPVQLLWVNLIMDTFAALALSTEPPSNSLLQRKPYSREDHMITKEMLISIVSQSIYQLIVLLVILFFGPEIWGVKDTSEYVNDGWNADNYVHFTIFFQTFVMMQVFNAINCRKLKKSEINVFARFCNNPFFFLIELIILVIQFFLVQFGGQFIKLSPLTLSQHLSCIAFGVGTLIYTFLIKQIPYSFFEKFIGTITEKTLDKSELDHSLPSMLRRRSSSRMHHSSGKL